MVSEPTASPVEQRWRRREGITWMFTEGEAVLYDRDADSAVVLNATAAAMWLLLDPPATEGAIIEAMTDRPWSNAHEMRGGLESLFGHLRESGLIEVSESQSDSTH